MAAFPEYTGIDFSEQGLSVARATTSGEWPGARFVSADAVALPFADASFDCVYSGHMLYHIAEPASQERALSEMVRVLRPGGALVLVSANPRPLLFPLRLLIRLVAETPGLRRIARRIKGPSPVPYNPQRIRWIRSRLARAGTVTVISGGMASTAFNRKVSEFRNPGRMLWLFLDRTEERFPQSAAHLGNYAVFLFRRADGAIDD
jgi:ubiquinone/menaquinone biosynthesis C-methylase UbiE